MRLYEKLGFEEYGRKPVPEKVAKKIGINYFFVFEICGKIRIFLSRK
jgi:hypothetical protein